jgi:hypothetical protein
LTLPDVHWLMHNQSNGHRTGSFGWIFLVNMEAVDKLKHTAVFEH